MIALAEEHLVGIPTGRLVLCAVAPVGDRAAGGRGPGRQILEDDLFEGDW
jgi:hypothetical protein